MLYLLCIVLALRLCWYVVQYFKESGLLRYVMLCYQLFYFFFLQNSYYRILATIRFDQNFIMYRNFFQSVILQEKKRNKIHEMFANAMMSTLLKVFLRERYLSVLFILIYFSYLLELLLIVLFYLLSRFLYLWSKICFTFFLEMFKMYLLSLIKF